MLMERGLVLGDTSYVFSELYQKDTVIAQSKRAGSTAYYGDSIDLVISLGSEESVEMPQLIGKSLDDAEELVESLGLILAVTHYIKNDGTYLPNTVINQSPKSNESIRKGSEVHLIIVGR
jgi:serine/threonine-protein kinase